MILVVWIALIILTTFYCYFCEQRLFPNKKALRSGEFSNSKEMQKEEGSVDENSSGGFLHSNMAASLPKADRQSRKEVCTHFNVHLGIIIKTSKIPINFQFRKSNSISELRFWLKMAKITTFWKI